MAITNFKKHSRGFTMLFGVLIAGLALAIGVAIYDLASRQLALSQTTAQSQLAIYAADTGAECALYWDYTAAAFGTSSTSRWPAPDSGLMCNGFDITSAVLRTVNPETTSATAATTTFSMFVNTTSYDAKSPCALVYVAKYTAGGKQRTTITSRGFNTCTVATTTQVERVLQLNY